MPLPAVGSGLDIPALVSQLVSSSRAPTAKRIAIAEHAANAKLSAFSKIKQTLDDLKTSLDTLNKHADTPALAAKVADDAGFSASASGKAVAGHYEVEVVRLASAHKLASSEYAADAHPGAGTLGIKTGSETLSVEIAADASLSDIASAINAQAGKAVTASVVSADDGQHLVLTAREPGQAHALAVTASGADGLQALATALTTQTPAQDALVKVDGFERSVSGNSASDIIPGVSLSLTRASEGKPFALTISPDNSALKSSLEGFARTWNAANQVLKSSSAYDASTRRASVLTGDSLVRTLQQQLRGQVSDDLTGLKALGLTIDKDGRMVFDSAVFDKAVSEHPDTISTTLGRDSHYAKALGGMLKAHLDKVDGSLTQRHKSLDKQIKGYADQIEVLDTRMRKLSTLYTTQFTAMEKMIVQMQGSAGAIENLLKSMNQK